MIIPGTTPSRIGRVGDNVVQAGAMLPNGTTPVIQASIPMSGDATQASDGTVTLQRLGTAAASLTALDSQYSNATTNFTDVKGTSNTLQVAYGSGETWWFEIEIVWDTFTGTGGALFQLTGANITTLAASVSGVGASANAIAKGEAITATSTPTSNAHHTFAGSATYEGTSRIEGYFTSNGAGTLKLQAKAGAGSTTVKTTKAFIKALRQIK